MRARVRCIILIDGLLTIIDNIEWFLGRDVGIPIDIVFQRRWLETAIILGADFAINMPCPFTIFSDD